MIPAPEPRRQAAPPLRRSLACLPVGPRLVGAGRTGDAVVCPGVSEAGPGIAGAGEGTVAGPASIPRPSARAPGLAAASPVAARAGA